ncbi:hypothetical protein F7734_39680 [Scytonema sp. UIC 10036]|uniref:hypothetical protein n=1 Tax=Scytonema sp. UIC 10036 TaxID=2304196 RepID=UPI0012DA92F2|nr:hypothetical protein [Scytonema sp. UIC 10036]MUG98105.1 hypothetical protein [Scytonema sp. UIC 10036]
MHDFLMNYGHDSQTDFEESLSKTTNLNTYSEDGFNLDSDSLLSVEDRNDETWHLDADNELQNRSSDSPLQGEEHEQIQEPKFAAAGRCYWCSGTGVQWSGGQNIKCYSCGGSGVGAR